MKFLTKQEVIKEIEREANNEDFYNKIKYQFYVEKIVSEFFFAVRTSNFLKGIFIRENEKVVFFPADPVYTKGMFEDAVAFLNAKGGWNCKYEVRSSIEGWFHGIVLLPDDCKTLRAYPF